jgi:hypothetical protein
MAHPGVIATGEEHPQFMIANLWATYSYTLVIDFDYSLRTLLKKQGRKFSK